MARKLKIAAAQLGPLHKADSRAAATARLVKLLRDAPAPLPPAPGVNPVAPCLSGA